MFKQLVVVLALGMVGSPALAVPMQLAHSGRIFDNGGLPLSGNVVLHVRLYDQGVGGSVVWEEQQTVVFDNGYFAVELGANAVSNPLDDALFDDDLFVTVAIDTDPELPRQPVLSVPFAIRARSATNVSGGVVDASELKINGVTVIDGAGAPVGLGASLGGLSCVSGEVAAFNGSDWACTPATTDTLSGLTCSPGQFAAFNGSGWSCSSQAPGSWTSLTGVPLELLDGDDDLLASTTCAEGELLAYSVSFAAWGCVRDQVLDELTVEGFVTDGPLDLATGTTMGLAPLATLPLDWSDLSGLPTGFDDGIDDDTLASLAPSCSDGQLAKWSASGAAWMCASDDVLAEATVEGFISNGPLTLDAGTTLGGLSIATGAHTNNLDWTALTGVPGGFADNIDDDALGGLLCTSGQLAVYDAVSSSWACGDDQVLDQAAVVSYVQGAAGLSLGGDLAAGGSIQVGSTTAACTDTNAGTLRWTATGTMELCAGATLGWWTLAQPTLGSQSNPGLDCADIQAKVPSSPDGSYWIDPNGGDPADAFQAYCDMSGGGYTLCASLTKGYVPLEMLHNVNAYAFRARKNGSADYVFDTDAPARFTATWNQSETLNYGQFCRAMPSVSETKIQWKTWNWGNNNGATLKNTNYNLTKTALYAGNLFTQWFTNSTTARSFTRISGDTLTVTSDNNGYGGSYITANVSWSGGLAPYTHSANPWGDATGSCTGCTANAGYSTLPYGQTGILNNLSDGFWTGIPNVARGWSDCTANGDCNYHESGYGVWLFWVK